MLSLETRLALPVGPAEFSIGPSLRYTSTSDGDGTQFISAIADTLYGAGDFLQVGLSGGVDISRSSLDGPRRDLGLTLGGAWHPAVADVRSSFANISAEVTSALGLGDPAGRAPIILARAGGEWLSGTFPYTEAAYLGGNQNLRGWTSDRFAGDRSLSGSLEVRQPLGRFTFMLPGELGLAALADVGRVYVDGDSPGGWHTGVGGGLWFNFLDRRNTISLSIVRSEERSAFYTSLGYGF